MSAPSYRDLAVQFYLLADERKQGGWRDTLAGDRDALMAKVYSEMAKDFESLADEYDRLMIHGIIEDEDP